MTNVRPGLPEGSWFDFWQRQDIFHSLKLWGSAKPPTQWIRGTPYPTVKLIIHPHLPLRLGMGAAVPLLPHTPLWLVRLPLHSTQRKFVGNEKSAATDVCAPWSKTANTHLEPLVYTCTTESLFYLTTIVWHFPLLFGGVCGTSDEWATVIRYTSR